MYKKKEKLVIINADDLGLSPAVNEAINEYYTSGSITGTSMIACGENFSDACSMLRSMNENEVGVHLTLTGGLRPCTENIADIKTLLQSGDVFINGYGRLVSKYFKREIKTNEIVLEFEAQIEKVKREGFSITHIDSHEHIHMLPGILKIVVGLARKYNIPYIRIPVEPFYVVKKSFRIIDLVRYIALRSASLFAYRGSLKTEKDICYNDAFLGHFHSCRITDDILSFLVKRVSLGITEVAVHPGTKGSDLINGTWKAAAESSGVKLITHREAVSSKQ